MLLARLWRAHALLLTHFYVVLISYIKSSLVPRLSCAPAWKDSLDSYRTGRFLGCADSAVAKTGKPIRSLERGLSYDYRMTSVELIGAPNVYKSSLRATLCLTDLVRIKFDDKYNYATSMPKRLWLHESHQELMHLRIRLRHEFQQLSFCSSRKSIISQSTL